MDYALVRDVSCRTVRINSSSRVEVDLDAPALALADDADARAEQRASAALPRRACGRRRAAALARLARRLTGRLRRIFLTSDSVSRTESAARDHVARDATLLGSVGERQQRACVAHRQARRRHFGPHLVGQLQQPQHVRDRRAVLADGVGDVFLRQMELVGETPVGERLVDRIEIFALDVFDRAPSRAATRSCAGATSRTTTGTRSRPAFAPRASAARRR